MEAIEKIHRASFLPPRSIKSNSSAEGLYREIFKRSFDLSLAILLLPIIFPVLLFLIFILKIDSRGPAIFKSIRIGQNGKAFKIYKLRTMYQNASEVLEEILNSDESLREEWNIHQKLKNDPRVTRIGKFLRALSLDEIPQIINIIKGEMSFVGPRPITKEEITKYGKNFYLYKSIRPGVTGLWQVNGRSNISYPYRVSMDARYAQESSFNLDMGILIKTIPVVLSQKGAY